MIQAQLFNDSFVQYHQENPQVYRAFERFTLQTIQRGFDHYSAKGIFELVRWHSGTSAEGDNYKVNNNYTPFYARMFEGKHPQHDGFFRKRKSKFDKEMN